MKEQEKQELITLPVIALEWLTVEGFINHYLGLIENDKPLKFAYESAEADFQKYFKKRRYGSYGIFIRAKAQHQRTKLKKHQTNDNKTNRINNTDFTN
jgi:hypothetical protein